MTTMHCQQFEEMLAQQPEGPLPLAAANHLESCPRCCLLRDDLQAIAVAAREWGREELAPPPHLWASIQVQLQAEGLIAGPGPHGHGLHLQPAANTGWLARWWNAAPRLELAGAYVLLLLIAAGLAGYRNDLPADPQDRPVAATQISQPALDGLGRTLDGNMQRVVASFSEYDGSVALSLRRNLATIDNLIAVCEKSVREHPGDPLAREYLYGAYQQKADLLSVAMDRSTLEIK
jgi:hypothetical protein